MSARLARRTGRALAWKGAQHAGVQGIYFLRVVVLARLLVPDDFGLYAVAMIALDLLTRLTNLGMEPALVQHGAPRESTYRTAWTIGLLRAATVSGSVLLLAPVATRLFAEPRALPIIQVLALRPILDAVASARMAERLRELDFRSVALVRLPEAVVATVTAVALAPSFGVWSLVAGTLSGSVARSVLSYLAAPWKPGLALARADARSLVRFGRWIFATGLINVTGTFALRTIVTRELGAAQLGIYYLASRLAFLPASVVSEIVGAVAFPLFARVRDDARRAARVFRLVLVASAALLVPACAILVALAPDLVENLLGARWEGTVPLIRLLAVAAALGLFGEAVVPVLHGTGRPRQVALLELVQTSTLLVVLLLALEPFGIAGAAAAWIPAVLLTQIVALRFVTRALPLRFAGLALPLVVFFVIAVLVAATGRGIAGAIPGAGGVLAALAGSAAVALGALVAAERFGVVSIGRAISELFPGLPFLAPRPGGERSRP